MGHHFLDKLCVSDWQLQDRFETNSLPQGGPLLVRNGARIHINGLTWTFKSGCHEKTLRNGELTPVKRNHLASLWRGWYKWIFIWIISPLQVELWVTFNWWQGPNRSNENQFMRVLLRFSKQVDIIHYSLNLRKYIYIYMCFTFKQNQSYRCIWDQISSYLLLPMFLTSQQFPGVWNLWGSHGWIMVVKSTKELHKAPKQAEADVIEGSFILLLGILGGSSHLVGS